MENKSNSPSANNYWANLNRLLRYIQRGQPGFAFACHPRQQMVQAINRQIVELLEDQQIKVTALNLDPSSELSFIRQLKNHSSANALIINNLSYYIHAGWDKTKLDTPPKLQEINFAREELLALGIPLIFWVSSETTAIVSNRATDLYTQRSINTVYFDEVSERTFPVKEIEPAFGDKMRSTEEYEAIRLKIRLLKKQMQDALQNKYPKAKVADSLVLPLAKAYSEIDLHSEAIELIKRYNKDLNKNRPGVLVSLAKIYSNAGDYKQAIALLEKVKIGFSENEDIKKQSEVLLRLGDVLQEAGKLKDALRQYNECAALLNQLLNKNPKDSDMKFNFGITFSRLGDIQIKLGDLDKALNYYEDRSKIGKELYEAYPQNVSFKNGLAISYEKLGQTYSALGNLDKALKYYEEYSRLEKELYEAYPQNVSFKNGLAVSYTNLAVFFRDQQNDGAKALMYFKKAQVLWKQLVKDAPQYAEFQKSLQRCHDSIKNLS